MSEVKGCNVLFKSGSGIIICGEKRVDGNCFLCIRCLKDNRPHDAKDVENVSLLKNVKAMTEGVSSTNTVLDFEEDCKDIIEGIGKDFLIQPHVLKGKLWWKEAMEEAYKKGFSSGQQDTINALKYVEDTNDTDYEVPIICNRCKKTCEWDDDGLCEDCGKEEYKEAEDTDSILKERICIKCGIKDSSDGWCPDCQRCWNCVEHKCIKQNTKDIQNEQYYHDNITKLSQKYKRNNALCVCGHKKEYHNALGNYSTYCYDQDCNCGKFVSQSRSVTEKKDG